MKNRPLVLIVLTIPALVSLVGAAHGERAISSETGTVMQESSLPSVTEQEPPQSVAVPEASSMHLNRHSLNSGGAMDVASASYRMGMSVGQSAAGEAHGTQYALGIGFWYGVLSACPISLDGDVNESGTLTAADIIYMVVHVFKSGPPAEPCAANGDVNCSGAVTAADIIYMVVHVFKSGPPPCDICNNSSMPCP